MRPITRPGFGPLMLSGYLLGAVILGPSISGGLVDSARAQDIASTFETFQGSTDELIAVDANMLEIDDKAKQAIFKGNVVARQGDFSLKARELAMHYTGQPAADVASESGDSGEGEGGRITRIEARGKVLVSKEDELTATSDWADFDVQAQMVTIGGNVVLSQNENVLRGDRLVIDIKSGKTRLEVDGDPGEQRIRGLFRPNQG